MIEVRPYASRDREACLAVLESQIPASFTWDDRSAFAEFLDTLEAPYFVVEYEGRIIACGGYYVRPEEGRLTWGMVDARKEGQGIGKFLLYYRLRELSKLGIAMVGIETSPESEGFFLRQGFRREAINPGGFGPGRDSVRMVKRLEVCS